jgi:murein L,D-transpeptidase YcbB/YkuD
MAAADPAIGQTNPIQDELIERMDHLSSTGQLSIGEADIAAVRLIPAFYEQREYLPAWSDAADTNELIGLLEQIDQEGLDPGDYFLGELKRLAADARRNPNDHVLLADLDILATESLIRLGYHLRFGKVNPEQLDPNWNLSRDLDGVDPVQRVQQAIESDSLTRFVRDAFPRADYYKRLKSTLAKYRSIEKDGGWPRVQDGPVFKPGMSDQRVVQLRKRLESSGDFTGAPAEDPELYDAALAEAVESYQDRHGLDADGAVGPKTLETLNVPVEQRIGQIRVNLERARWVLRNLGNDYIITNIAGFRVYLVRNEQIVWSGRAQVGKTYRKTPVFKGMLKYLEFNPTWTVPPGILNKDVLPAIQRDPGYLSKKNMNVIDGNGKIVDPSSLDWASYRGRGFPYSIRQEPGPSNALGRVKFIFPNKHFVFLHDTPSKALFGRAERTFSSGCIRVENPFDLAELLLEKEAGWDRAKIQAVLDSEKTQRAFLSDPLPVLLLYWTVDMDQPGPIGFRADVYERDQRVLDALDGDFVLSVPRGVPEYLQGD